MKAFNLKNLPSYFYILPALVMTGVFSIAPMFYTVWLGFVYYRIGALSGPNGTFVGLSNFQTLFADSTFWISLLNSIMLGLGANFGVILLAIVTALIINKSFKGRGIFRSLVLIPWAIPTVVSGQFWRILYMENSAVSNILYNIHFISRPSYSLIGIMPPTIFDLQQYAAIFAVAVALIWRHSPFASLIILGGLQGVPKDLYDSANVDGASTIQTFRYITFPSITRFINMALLFVTLAIGGEMAMVLGLTMGGPGYKTEIVGLYLWKIYFLQFNFGVGGAFSVILALWSLVTCFPLILMLFRQIMKE
jgi:multiple sugar transport system permease protein